MLDPEPGTRVMKAISWLEMKNENALIMGRGVICPLSASVSIRTQGVKGWERDKRRRRGGKGKLGRGEKVQWLGLLCNKPCHYITLHYIVLHYITFAYHSIPFNSFQFHSISPQFNCLRVNQLHPLLHPIAGVKVQHIL